MRRYVVLLLLVMLIAVPCLAQDPENSAWSASPTGVYRIYFNDNSDAIEVTPLGELAVNYLIPLTARADHNLIVSGGGGGGTSGGAVETSLGYTYVPVDINPNVMVGFRWTFSMLFPSESFNDKMGIEGSETWLATGGLFTIDFSIPGFDLPASFMLGASKGFLGKPNQATVGLALPMSPKTTESTLRSKYPADYGKTK